MQACRALSAVALARVFRQQRQDLQRHLLRRITAHFVAGQNRTDAAGAAVPAGAGADQLVRIGDDVEIGANSTVDNGTIRNTEVSADARFDIDLLGEEKTAHNLEGSLGLTVFF